MSYKIWAALSTVSRALDGTDQLLKHEKTYPSSSLDFTDIWR